MKILIVGAGIGGLTLAAFLKKKHQVTIVEKRKKLGHLGFSIGVWRNGRFILNKLGLEEIILNNGNIIENYQILNSNNKILASYDLKKNMKRYWPAEIQITRDFLYQSLLNKVSSLNIKTDTTINKIEQNRNIAKVTISNNKYENYDLIVGSDGINSVTRTHLFPSYKKNKKNQIGYWLWIKNCNLIKRNQVTEIVAPNQFFGTYPHGSQDTCAYFVRYSKSKNAKLSDIPKYFPDIIKAIPELREQFCNTNTSYIENIVTIKLKNWYNNNVVLIGDAAHGFQAFAGIGGSMAMEDAYVLSQEINKFQSLENALKNYQKRRMPRVNRASKLTNKLNKWKVIKNPQLSKLREFVSPYIPINYFANDYIKLMSEPI